MYYVDVPQKIDINELLSNKSSFSPHNYKKVILKNKFFKPVKDFLSGDLIKGEEVGSDAYIQASNRFFIRNKALRDDSFLLDFIGDSKVPILPNEFVDFQLREGDIIISKDSNIGEAVILDKDYTDYMISGGLYKMPVSENKYYLLAFLKHNFFKTQLNFLVSKGATIRHAKKLFLDCIIPLPNQANKDEVFRYVEILVRAVINKEKQIKSNEETIFKLIEKELLANQKSVKKFHYEFPTLDMMLRNSRLDAGFYCENYAKKQFLISNYIHEAGTIKDWGFEIGRGQNLQVSAIGKSIYSEDEKENFYILAQPTHLSDYGTVTKYEYLGNRSKLSLIQEGDIIFSAEGSIGKCVMFANPKQKLITNIHGIVLNKKNHNKQESAFVCCFLRYLRKLGVLDYISVGGQGGSLAMKYWSEIKIPFFPKNKRDAIAKLYYCPHGKEINKKTDLNTFDSVDASMNSQVGILDLDDQIKIIKNRINIILDNIIDGKKIDIDFSFLGKF